MPSIERLTEEDWVEIYYALESKAISIEHGAYGEDKRDKRSWIAHLRNIMDTIGPDGSDMVKNSEKIRIVITVEGGLAQNIYSEREAVDVIILDGDIEGADESEITKVPDDDGIDLEWVMSGHHALVDAGYINRVFQFMGK